MKTRLKVCGRIALAAFVLLVWPLSAAQDTGWKDTAEFSLVSTSGNSETTTLGFKNTLSRAWERSAFVLKAGAVRAESTTTTSFAVGNTTTFNVFSTDIDTTTAENYYLNGRFDRKITDRFFWFTGLGWDRNEFAGIENRYIGEAGVGNIWRDEDDLKFSTAYGLTYTKQDDVLVIPGVEDKFLGARGSWVYLNKIGDNTTYENLLVLDLNLDETEDWRADMINSLAVAMNHRLAIKLTHQLLYDNTPSFKSAPLYDLDPSDPLAVLLGTVPVELDEVDSVFTASLVINF